MGKYLRLLRLQDEHFQLGFALASGAFLGFWSGYFLLWGLSVTLISFCAFIVNELVDREDVDTYSWNKAHLRKNDKINGWVAGAMWLAFAILGLLIALALGLFWWALAMLLIGTFYSAKPIRLKAIPIFDILAQLSVWFLIPFLGPIFYFGRVDTAVWQFVATLSLICWGFFYPYQLADFSADKKVGLKGTHVVIGMEKSLLLGLLALVSGLVFYFIFDLFMIAPWSIAFILMGVILLGFYFYWFSLPRKKREVAMQRAVGWVKPISWAMVPYLAFWLFK